MKLYVMRHGPAEEAAASGADADRALTPSGRERVRAVAKRLAEENEEPSSIITSPLVRAVQTAEIVAFASKVGDRGGTVIVAPELAPAGKALALARKLACKGERRVMFVGHEPDLSHLVEALVGRFERPFEKATVVAVHLSSDGERAYLRFVLCGKSLKLDPDARSP
jgi:phosphohistidine phosphatase